MSNPPTSESIDYNLLIQTSLMRVSTKTMKNELNHERTERLAYQFWLERGCPFGTPEVDWLRAEDELRRENFPTLSAFALGPETSV